MATYYTGNRYLSLAEMTVNAQYIMNYLLPRGWTKNAIAGMLGNMQTESTINPGIWQNLDEGNMNVGFGLVQWTPASKYINWANERGLDYKTMDANLERIIWEVENNVQWISTSQYPMSFQEFMVSTQSPEYLAQVFLINYERPANQNQPERSTQARYWFDNLDGATGGQPAWPTTEGLPITSPYGWRTNPITGEMEFHAAIDISGNGVNHPVYATQSGIVYDAGWNDSMGYYVMIDHTGDPYYSRYIHLAEPPMVSIGDTVVKGQQIGIMGTTGDSTGIHLEFAIAITPYGWGSEDTTIDPEIYLQMNFGGGDSDIIDKQKDVIMLLLSDALNGWKF